MITIPKGGGLTVTIQLTNKCQLDCPYCMATKNNDNMPKHLVLKTLHELGNLVPTDRPVQLVWHGVSRC
jgi:sulfatase maturation enzyme AslB (radical SAM superfamily)